MKCFLVLPMLIALTNPSWCQGVDLRDMPKVHGFEPVALISGIAGVEDGDGITFGTHIEIRLNGIAAPEDSRNKVSAGGPESTENLRQTVEGKDVTCLLDGIMNGKRLIGICFINGLDVGRLQVETGHARDCPNFSNGRYADAEARAKAKGYNLEATYRLPRYCG